MTDSRFIRKALSGKLTPAQRYALVLLMEECGEMTAICSKALRWGFESFNPFDPGVGNNATQIRAEWADLVGAKERLDRALLPKNPRSVKRPSQKSRPSKKRVVNGN